MTLSIGDWAMKKRKAEQEMERNHKARQVALANIIDRYNYYNPATPMTPRQESEVRTYVAWAVGALEREGLLVPV